MALVEKDKTNPTLVFLIVSAAVIGAVFIFSKILSYQSEDKIRLAKQGDENLKEYIVSETGQKVALPPVDSGSAEETDPNLDFDSLLSQNSKKNESPAPNVSDIAEPAGTLPKMIINKESSYKASIDTTEGKIVIELDIEHTPITSNNFITLARKSFYNTTIFHRVLNGFMIQGGDPTGTGAGGPGYQFDDEPFVGEYTRGTVAMANAGPNTNGSQFFIMHKDYPLSKNYVIFGKVVEGMDTVDKIAEAPVTMSQTGEKSRPLLPVVINSIEIIETLFDSKN